MKTMSSLPEDLLMEQYAQPAFLPPLWRIIFQEAMRGHHLLFAKTVSQSYFDNLNSPSKSHSNKNLEEFCVHLFAAPDLKTIRSMIGFLPDDEQKQLFGVYLNMMGSFRRENKQHMN
ncbi:MAG: hypothetical protein NTX25_14770 [Proteobacteria bacterium]|nr:hypothetical protein [Pseudomonadota bacterium]